MLASSEWSHSFSRELSVFQNSCHFVCCDKSGSKTLFLGLVFFFNLLFFPVMTFANLWIALVCVWPFLFFACEWDERNNNDIDLIVCLSVCHCWIILSYKYLNRTCTLRSNAWIKLVSQVVNNMIRLTFTEFHKNKI